MARKTFATPVEESIQNEFKIECKKQGYKQNEVIEVLMSGFCNGDIQIKKKARKLKTAIQYQTPNAMRLTTSIISIL